MDQAADQAAVVNDDHASNSETFNTEIDSVLAENFRHVDGEGINVSTAMTNTIQETELQTELDSTNSHSDEEESIVADSKGTHNLKIKAIEEDYNSGGVEKDGNAKSPDSQHEHLVSYLENSLISSSNEELNGSRNHEGESGSKNLEKKMQDAETEATTINKKQESLVGADSALQKEAPEDIMESLADRVDEETNDDNPVLVTEEQEVGDTNDNDLMSTATNSTDNDGDASVNDDDLASGAAMAMAAVAVAASANTTSPSAAAEAARALAPDLVQQAISPRNHDITEVQLSAVKAQMLKRTSVHNKKIGLSEDDETGKIGLQQLRNRVQQRLASGENDAFLEHMLLLQYFWTRDGTSEVDCPQHLAAETTDKSKAEAESIGQSRALESSEKVRSMFQMAEDAYDAMAAMLPPLQQDEQIDVDDGDSDYYGIDAPLVVPDLLPPCTSVPGDATLQFFLACLGEREEKSESVKNLEESRIAADDTLKKGSVDVGGQVAAILDDTQPADATDSLSGSNKSAASVFTRMFSSMTPSTKATPPTRPSNTLAGVFRKRTRPESSTGEAEEESSRGFGLDAELLNGEYSVSIDREMLGLTVENVLERTVVRTVLPGGAAKKAGAKVGSLIVKVGNVETKNLTHFETIDELRQSQRPLKLVLRQITSDALRSAREEMGRLIRGGGFGTSLPLVQNEHSETGKRAIAPSFRRTHHGKPTNVEAFSQVLHQRWNREGTAYTNKKEEALVHAGEKLVWILTLLVLGLEREASQSPIVEPNGNSFEGSPGRRSRSSHAVEDYADAARSVARVLSDFISARLLPKIDQQDDGNENADASRSDNLASRMRRIPPQPPGRLGARSRAQEAINANRSKETHALLLRIGDVLHRTRSFLADPASPPAALLRGEIVSFLCDLLDIDTDMELSEEEAGSSINAATINDLGSAGSLLKLIILNCSMMRSPGCTSLTNTRQGSDVDLEEEQQRRFGLKKESKVDLHRFHAGNRFLAVVHRLAASRSISARVTACSLGPVLWGHLDFPHQLQLRGVITRALHDVDVIVRKSTATVLHEIAELVFDPRAVPWLVLMCERAMTDPEPQLRAAAMTLTWHLSEHLPNAFLGDASQGSRSLRRLPQRSDPTFAEVYLLQCKLLPVATRLAEDRAPSVRLAVAAQCDRLCNSLGEHWYSVIIDVLQALLGDIDEHVRGEAILCVPRLVEIVLVSSTPERAGVGVLEALLPVSVKLQNDPSPNVRVALATAAGDLLTLLVGLESLYEISPPSSGDLKSDKSENAKNKEHVDNTLIPLLQTLLHATEPEVTSAALRAVTNASRGNVREIRARQNSRAPDDDTISLSSFQSHTSLEKKDPVFIPVLSEEQVLRLLPTLSDLANSRQWRVRQGAVEIVPALLGCTSKLEIRSEVAQLCFRLMTDKVDAVRKTAAECLCLSGGGLGSHGEESSGEWISAIVIPHVRSCSRSVDSKQRILSLKMVEVILVNGICPVRKKSSRTSSSEQAQPSSPQLDLVGIATSLSADSVANVRLNFGRVACSIVSIVDEEELGLLIKALQSQIEAEKKRERGGDRDVLFFASRAILRCREKDDASLPSLRDSSER